MALQEILLLAAAVLFFVWYGYGLFRALPSSYMQETFGQKFKVSDSAPRKHTRRT
jgi:hypothetical protein